MVWYFAGSTDENLSVRPGGFSGAFAPLAGIRVEEHHPLAADESIELSDGSRADAWAEDLQTHGAEVLATFTHAPLAGRPAITRNRVGAGTVHYLATRLDAAALGEHLGRIVAEAGVTPEHPQAGGGVEIVRRYSGEGSYLFVFNHGEQPRTLALTGYDLLTGTHLDGDVELAPAASIVLRETASPPTSS